MRKYDLVCFDMDGVLTKVRSSWAWVHECFGVDSEPSYRAFCNGEIDENEFMRRDIALWKGVKPDVNIRDIAVLFRDMPLIDGIQETVACLNECGIKSHIVSGGIDLAAKMLADEFGFSGYVADHICTNEDGTLTGEGVKVVDLADKGLTVRPLIERYGTTKERTASIGNSFTDIRMFESTGMSIAFNPSDPYTEEAATHVVRSDNISDVLDYILEEDRGGLPLRHQSSSSMMS
ncbi:MAG: HAD-IB family phosphatase [Candidatus Methanomethylophilaceae archaeon]|jgi:phosphoserine phosphatase|nr:HAD-IB family phosphatase [Candidatus Methanomethylophilaceae archaeon]